MLQYIARGVWQALEDAVCLAGCVAESQEDTRPAFTNYRAIWFPRTARVQTSARQFGEIAQIDSMGAVLRTALVNQRAENDFT